MRILFLVPYIPTPIRTRPYNLLRSLAGCGHDLTLFCVAQGEGLWAQQPAPLETAALEELQAMGIRTHTVVLPRWRSFLNCLRALPTSLPLQAVYCWSPPLARLLQAELAGRCDAQRNSDNPGPTSHAQSTEPRALLHIEHLRGARYGLQVLTSNQVPIIWDSVDCISHLFAHSSQRGRGLFSRIITRVELPRTRRYERTLLQRFNQVLVTSPVDKKALELLVSEHLPAQTSQRTHVLPNGVDLAYFRPNDTPHQPGEIVFTGKMSYHANVTAALFLAQEVLPLVLQKHPAAHLTLVGSSPTPAVRALSCPHITVTSYVPDIRPYLRRATVAVAPMPYGAGIQNKVLEAMACATPVVATPSAVSALDTQPEHEVLLGGTPTELSNQVLRLLGDPTLRQRLGGAGRAYVEKKHDWRSIVNSLEDIYRQEIAHWTKRLNRV